MTSSIAVVQTSGNKKLKVIVETLTAEGWVERDSIILYGPGNIAFNDARLYIHNGQRIRIEEFGEFIN